MGKLRFSKTPLNGVSITTICETVLAKMKKNTLQILILIFAISISNYGQNNSNSGETLFQEIDKLHKKELIEASRRINVSTLKDAKFKDNEAELRLWTIDHFFIESFILQRKNDQWKARHISFDNQEGKIEQDVYILHPAKTKLI